MDGKKDLINYYVIATQETFIKILNFGSVWKK